MGSVVAVFGGLAWFAFEFDLFSFFGLWPYIIIGVGLLAFVSWWGYDAYRARKHQVAMRDFALMHGWTYQKRSSVWARKMRSFPFGQGTHRRDLAVLSGTFNKMPCATFVHEYETRTDERKSATQVWQVTAISLPFPLATVDIIPDDMVAKVAKLLGGQDIDFESAEFNAKWRVKAGNSKYAHDIVHPRMMERLNKYDARGLAIRVEGDVVLAWQAGRQPNDSLARRLGVLTSVARLIPEFVYREFAAIHVRADERISEAESDAPEWARSTTALVDGKYNAELADPKYDKKLEPRNTAAKLDKGSMVSLFPEGFFTGGVDGLGGIASGWDN